ncbi:GAF domain-containing protein [Atopobium fossor]|uniref:GAF domain-containing protein n=1 Tax=Atopobium fossor TaxID=39487 RepID=UPI0004121094|nr:GAF domain-containing protein [Atopobium fossor]
MTQSLLIKQAYELVDAESAWLPALANVAALLWESMDDVSWVGFYLRRSIAITSESSSLSELVLGPFQGKIACTRIAWGKGVCGTAAAANTTQLVTNVHEFPGHIACDSASNSEVVVPMHNGAGEVVAVLDIDSASLSRFSIEDATLLENLVATIEKSIDWACFTPFC